MLPLALGLEEVFLYSDMHVHTDFSDDCQVPAEAQVARALALGMAQVAVTDHQDLDYPPWTHPYLLEDTEGYISRLLALKEAYGDRIEVLVGIELGLQAHLGDRLARYTRAYPFDIVIASTHCFEGRDTEDQTLYEGREDRASTGAYFQAQLDNLRAVPSFDVVGHMDFVLRDLPSRNRAFSYEEHARVLDDTLRLLISRGQGIECNTKAVEGGLEQFCTHPSILRRYRELGGEIITLGSDAHKPADLGRHFSQSAQLLRDCGFRYYCIYRQRQPVFLPL